MEVCMSDLAAMLHGIAIVVLVVVEGLKLIFGG